MYLFFRMLVEIYVRIKFNINIYGKENIPSNSKKGGFIIAANHQSYADPTSVSGLIRGKYSFMAKSELFENRIFGWLIRRCGAFPVVRGNGDNSAIERGIADIKKGRIFVIFPEGTRSKDGKIARGRTGVSLIASLAEAPVLPVCIMYGLKGEKRRMDFAVGKMIPAEELKIKSENQSDRKELKRISNRIMDSIKDLQKEIFINTGTVFFADNPEPSGKDADES